MFGKVPSGYKLSEVVHDHGYQSLLFYPSLEMCKILETVIVSKTLSFTQLTGRSAGEYFFIFVTVEASCHVVLCSKYLGYLVLP